MNRRDCIFGAASLALLAGRSASADEPKPPPSVAERLGYAKDARLLMLHADDLGMCHSANAASSRALTEGVASAASVMVPCPWFPEIAAWSREHAKADLGVHLTLTSEWTYYRWRPVSPWDRVPGLLDEEGFLWRSELDVKKHATPEEVETEIRAQIERARRFGMKPTHIDSHMGALFTDARFLEAYARLGKELGILPMLPSPTPDILLQGIYLGIDYAALHRKLRDQGFLFLDRLITGLNGKTFEARKADLIKLIRGLPPGLTEVIVHLSGDDEEIRHVTAAWELRWIDYRLMMDPEIRDLVRKEDVHLIGYRALSKLWPPHQ